MYQHRLGTIEMEQNSHIFKFSQHKLQKTTNSGISRAAIRRINDDNIEGLGQVCLCSVLFVGVVKFEFSDKLGSLYNHTLSIFSIFKS